MFCVRYPHRPTIYGYYVYGYPDLWFQGYMRSSAYRMTEPVFDNSKNMDPWSTCQQGDVTNFESLSFKFEDDFSLPNSQTLPKRQLISALPDSDQYLATLESKLKQLKGDSNIVEQLVAKREACMQQLLAGENLLEEEPDLNQPVNNLKNLLSSRQALNQGEIVDLLKHDQLENAEDIPESRRDSQEIRSP